jgi:hypothetical protein
MALAGLSEMKQASNELLAVPPPPNLKRWRACDKASLVLALRAGTMTRTTAYACYRLSEEELSCWEDAFDRDGMGGLLAKRLQIGSHLEQIAAREQVPPAQRGHRPT